MENILYYELDSLEHDLPLAAEFGHLIVCWSKAEDMIGIVAAEVIGIDHNLSLELMMRIPTFESRIKWMRHLLSQWEKTHPAKAKAVASLIIKLSELSVQRNQWVHGKWGKHETSKRTKCFDIRKPPGPDRGKVVNAQSMKMNRIAVTKATDGLIKIFPGSLLPSGAPIPSRYRKPHLRKSPSSKKQTPSPPLQS